MSLTAGGAAMSIAQGIREFGRAAPRQVAVVDGSRRITYADLAERARRLANNLLEFDLKRGDRVAVLMGNRGEYPEVAAGIAMAGLVMVPLNPRLTASETDFIIDHSGSRAIILDSALAENARTSVQERRLKALEITVPGAAPTLGADYELALAAAAATDPDITLAETEPFCIAYTSGTTAHPKGVVISHRSRVLTFYMSALEWGLGPGRISVAVAPMYHGAGFAFGYAPVFTGGTVVMLPKWDPVRLLELIVAERAQSVFLVPTHAQMLRALPPGTIEGYDLSSLDTLYFNAAALPWELKKWVMATFPGVGVHELYGSTEAGIVTNLRPKDMLTRPGSVGHPWFMTEIQVVRPDGTQVEPGEPGQLYSRSPFLMNHYHNNPEATAACTTEDGFLTCGDIVTLDEDGYISIVDRVNDIIISGGINVFPREIEEVLAAHPGVAEVAIVGTPHETWGQQVSAYVVRQGDTPVGAEQLESFCREHLASFKIPRTWEFIEVLPRNASGKILKRDLGAPPGS